MEKKRMETVTKKTAKSPRKKLAKKINKTGKLAVAIITFIGTLFGAWQAYKYFNTKDVGGEWYFLLTTTKSSYEPYLGETMGIKLFLKQDNGNISGTGE